MQLHGDDDESNKKDTSVHSVETDKFRQDTHFVDSSNLFSDKWNYSERLTPLQQNKQSRNDANHRENSHFPFQQRHFEQSKDNLRDRIQKRRQKEQVEQTNGTHSESASVKSPRGMNKSSAPTSRAGELSPRGGSVHRSPSQSTMSQHSPRLQSLHIGPTGQLTHSPPSTSLSSIFQQHSSFTPSSTYPMPSRQLSSHSHSSKSSPTDNVQPIRHNFPSSETSPQRHNVASSSPNPRSPRMQQRVPRRKVIFSLSEKRFLLRFVGEITGEFIPYENGWSEHFSNGRLLMELWRGLFSEKVENIQALVTILDVPSSIGWSSNSSSPSSPKAPMDQQSTSPQPVLPEIRIASIMEMISSGRTEIILLIISLCLKKKALSNFELRNHLNLIVLKDKSESVTQFKRLATAPELLKRQLNYILKECNWAGGKQISHLKELQDVRIYACLLRFLFPDLFSSDYFSFITVAQYDASPEKSAETILSFVSDLNPTRCIRSVQPSDLLSNSEMIHIFIISQLFELRSGLPVNYTSWDMLQLCFCHLQDEFPTILASKSFAKTVNISRDLSSVNMEDTTDYQHLYNSIKQQHDLLLKSYKAKLDELKNEAKQAQNDLMDIFEKYKEQASNQISFLKENKDELETLLEKQTIDYEREITSLRTQIDSVRRQTSMSLISSLETENQILSQQMNENKESMEVENAMLHKQVKDLKAEIHRQMQDLAQMRDSSLHFSREPHASGLPSAPELHKQLRSTQEKLATVKQQNRTLTQTVSEHRASKRKLTEANQEQQNARQHEENVYRERYNNVVSLTKEIRENLTMRLAVTQRDLQQVHCELEDILVLCPNELHWEYLKRKFGELHVDQFIPKSMHSGLLRKKENRKNLWTQCFAVVLSPGYLIYWSEKDRESREPLGLVRLNGALVKLMKSKRSFDFRFCVEVSSHKLKFSTSMDSERRDWVQRIRESTLLKGLQLLTNVRDKHDTATGVEALRIEKKSVIRNED